MLGIGGLNPISLLATSMMGPMGGIVAQLAQQVVSQFSQQLLQNIGQQMGLPQSAIEMAQGAYSGAAGDVAGSGRNLQEAVEAYGQEVGATPAQIGEVQRDINDMLARNAAEAVNSDEAKEAKSGGKGGGWLLALARALGAKADKMADKLEQQAAKLDTGKPSDSAEFQTTGQQFSMLMNSMTNSIKTIGEALANMARKN